MTPVGTRAIHKRELERAVDNLMWVYKHVERIVDTYEPVHPEIAGQARLIIMAVVELAQAIEALNAEI